MSSKTVLPIITTDSFDKLGNEAIGFLALTPLLEMIVKDSETPAEATKILGGLIDSGRAGSLTIGTILIQFGKKDVPLAGSDTVFIDYPVGFANGDVFPIVTPAGDGAGFVVSNSTPPTATRITGFSPGRTADSSYYWLAIGSAP